MGRGSLGVEVRVLWGGTGVFKGGTGAFRGGTGMFRGGSESVYGWDGGA